MSFLRRCLLKLFENDINSISLMIIFRNEYLYQTQK